MTEATEILRAPEDLALGTLSESLGFLLRLSQITAFEDFFESLGDFDVRPGEISVLTVIGENPGVRQGVVARRLMIKRANMTKVVRAMERQGFVRRTVPEDDKRSVELRLTKKGAARLAALRTPFQAHEARPVSSLSREEEAVLKRLLRKYIGLPEPHGGGGS
jgi:DNA-binding MarR family transcriptional regulator